MFSLDLDSKVLDPKNNQPFLSLLSIQSKGDAAIVDGADPIEDSGDDAPPPFPSRGPLSRLRLAPDGPPLRYLRIPPSPWGWGWGWG